MKQADKLLGGTALLAVAVFLALKFWPSGEVGDESGEKGEDRARSERGTISLEEARELSSARRIRAIRSGDRYAGQADEFRPLPEGERTDPGQVGPQESVATYKLVLGELDELIESERKLSKKEKADLYNRATGAYETMLVHVDGSDPTQRALLEQAHVEITSRMKELKLKRPIEKVRRKH